jgi:outer membrane protein assembly factor BamB
VLDARADWPQWRGPHRDGVSCETGLCFNWTAEGPPVVWRQPIGRGFSSPVVAAGRLYTMDQEETGNGTEPAQSFECVVCLDAATGVELWRFRYPTRYDERFGPGPRSTPCVDGESVYAVGATGVLHCLDVATGRSVWLKDLLKEFAAPLPQYGVSFSPLVDGNLVFVMPGGPGGNAVAALDKQTGALVWKALDDQAGYSSPVMTTAGGVRQVLFLTNSRLASFAAEDGRLYWSHPWQATGGFNIASPLTIGDYVLACSGYGKGGALLEVTTEGSEAPKAARVYEHNRLRPYFASPVLYEGHVYGFDQMDLVCMAVRTGAIRWREKGIRTFRKGSILAADGHLIILGEAGTLTLVEATPLGYREKASCRVSQTRCWVMPALAGGRLYVRDDAQIICFDLRK